MNKFISIKSAKIRVIICQYYCVYNFVSKKLLPVLGKNYKGNV